MLQAFHNDPDIKKKYIDRLELHYAQDEIIKGIYWEKVKGCAVGCTIHDSNHKNYEEELGISRILAILEDNIFEELPNDIAKEFPLRFLKCIELLPDTSLVFYKFINWLLIDKNYGVIKFAKSENSINSIKNISNLFQRKINGENIEYKAWESCKKEFY